MKLAVDGRIFSDGRVLSRGPGKWALGQIGALLRHQPDVDLSILVRPDGLETCRRLFPCARFVTYPERLCVGKLPRSDRAARLARDAEVAGWLEELRLDVLLDTAPFLLGLEPLPPLPGSLPTVACVHDPVPFAFASPRLEARGHSASSWPSLLDRLRFADSLLVSSEFVKRMASSVMGIAGSRVVVGYPYPAAAFGPSAAKDAGRAMESIGVPVPPTAEYILAAPATHRESGLRELIRAWAGLPRAFRQRLSLVLRSDVAPFARAEFESRVREAGLEGEVFQAEAPADDDLAALYASAWVYVHLPRHEGFALSVAEAQACGAAVVAPNASSLVEAAEVGILRAGGADADSLRACLLELDRNALLLENLRNQAASSASRFSSRRLYEAVVAAAETALAGRSRRRSSARRMRIGIVSPVPPQRSGVADYAAELAAALDRQADVEMFIEQGVSPALTLGPWPIHDARRLAERSRNAGFDVVLHQMGASSFHLFVERSLRAVPGIVTLHDLLWGRVLYHLRGDAEGLAALERRLRRLEGAAALSEFRRLLETGGPSLDERLDEFFSRHPVLADVLHGCRGVVVHFPDGARRIRDRFPGIPVRWFPMGVSDPLRPAVGPPAAARARHGLPPEGYIVGAFGLADPVKRLDVGVRALAGLLQRGQRADLLIAGRFTSEHYRERLSGLALALGVADRVHVVESPPMTEFEELLGACDAVVNLRYPSHLQMSATLVRAMAAGKPVVTTDLPEWRFLPEEACVWAPVGDGEVEFVGGVLGRWQEDSGERRRRGAAARRWYLENATLEAMSRNYMSFARELIHGARPATEDLL